MTPIDQAGDPKEPSREDYKQVWWRNHEGLRCSTFVRLDDPNAERAIERRADFKEWWSRD